MKTSFLPLLFSLVAIFTITSCQQDDELRPVVDKNIAKMSAEQLRAYNEKLATLEPAENPITSRVPIAYVATLLNGISPNYVDGANGSVGNVTTHQYYRLYANAGDVVTVIIHRVTCEYDASFYRYAGQYTDTNLLPGGVFNDDELSPFCTTCFAWGDPHDSWVAATGWYTIGASDFANCAGAPFTYNFEVSGLSDFIIIEGCHTTVLNGQHNATTTMQEAIDNCLANSATSAAFVACVTALTNTWVSQGKITRAQKSKIVTCAQGVAF